MALPRHCHALRLHGATPHPTDCGERAAPRLPGWLHSGSWGPWTGSASDASQRLAFPGGKATDFADTFTMWRVGCTNSCTTYKRFAVRPGAGSQWTFALGPNTVDSTGLHQTSNLQHVGSLGGHWPGSPSAVLQFTHWTWHHSGLWQVAAMGRCQPAAPWGDRRTYSDWLMTFVRFTTIGRQLCPTMSPRCTLNLGAFCKCRFGCGSWNRSSTQTWPPLPRSSPSASRPLGNFHLELAGSLDWTAATLVPFPGKSFSRLTKLTLPASWIPGSSILTGNRCWMSSCKSIRWAELTGPSRLRLNGGFLARQWMGFQWCQRRTTTFCQQGALQCSSQIKYGDVKIGGGAGTTQPSGWVTAPCITLWTTTLLQRWPWQMDATCASLGGTTWPQPTDSSLSHVLKRTTPSWGHQEELSFFATMLWVSARCRRFGLSTGQPTLWLRWRGSSCGVQAYTSLMTSGPPNQPR